MNLAKLLLIEAIIAQLTDKVNDKMSGLFVRRAMERAEADGWLPDLMKEMEVEVIKVMKGGPLNFGSDEEKDKALGEHARSFIEGTIENLKKV